MVRRRVHSLFHMEERKWVHCFGLYGDLWVALLAWTSSWVGSLERTLLVYELGMCSMAVDGWISIHGRMLHW